MKGRVLTIAGSDPSGGAGIQADIKTVTALGGYAATAVTALTVQNTKGVTAVHPTPPELIYEQIVAVLTDIGGDVIKIGMIGSVDVVDAIISAIHDCGWRREEGEPITWTAPIILDPVLVATSGDALADEGVAAALINKLAPLSAVITPNIEEAAALTGLVVNDRASMIAAGEALLAAGAGAALIKGGHLTGDMLEDVLVTTGGVEVFSNPRIDTYSTHGTGCTLASALATGLAQGIALKAAVKRAVDYTHLAIKTAPGLGAGHGPLNHAHTVKDF